MAQKVEHQSEGESTSKKEGKEVDQSKFGREAASASEHLRKLIDEHTHVDKSSSLSGIDMAQGDGSHLKVNARGQVTQVITPAGEVRQYKYGADGKPNEITDKTGTWQKGKDGSWHCTSDPSKAYKHADITVDKRGNCREAHDEGETVYLTNGTTMERDKQNRVTEIVFAGGARQQFQYDDKGRVCQYKDSQGTTWKSDNAWFWHNDKGERFEGAVTVNPKDGSYSRRDGYSTETTTYHGDNSRYVIDDKTGAHRHYSPDGNLQSVEFTRGDTPRKFEFEHFPPPGNGLKAVHEPNGSVFRTTDGKHWTNQTGQQFTGSITVEPDGTVRYCDEKNNVRRYNPDGTVTRRLADGHVIASDAAGNETEVHPPVSGKSVLELGQCAHDINKALKENRPEAIPELLKNRTVAERQKIEELYQRQFQRDLETDLRNPVNGIMDAGARDRALGYLRRRDGETPECDRLSKEAVYIHSQLSLLKENAGDRGVRKLAEEQLRSSLSTMNSVQIAELRKQYKETYKTDLLADLSSDKNLSADGKQALLIYSHGVDKRTDGDFMKLAEIALRNHDLKMFQEVFSQTQDGQRQLFIEHGGERRVKDAFGESPLDRLGRAVGHLSMLSGSTSGPSLESLRGGADAADTRANIALDYLHYGKRSVPTEIRESIKAVSTDESNVNHVISNMTNTERDMYKAGRALSARPPEPAILPAKVTAEQAIHFYKETHSALEDAARKQWEVKGLTKPDSLKVAQWEEAIMFPGTGFLRQLDANRGVFGSQNVEHFASEVERMSGADRQALAVKEGYRKFVYARLKEMYPDDKDYKRALDVLEKGGRQVNDRIDSATSPAEVISALAHLRQDSLEDLSRRHIDWDNLCDKVHNQLNGASKEDQAVADWLLSNARQGKLPNPELADSYVKALSGRLDKKQALNEFERLRNGTGGFNEMPPNVKAAFEHALLSKFDERERKDLEDHGRLAVADRVKLFCQGILGGDDKKALFQDLLSCPPEERKALANNPDLKRVLSKDQIEALTNSLNQPDANQKLERYAQLFGVQPDKKTVDALLARLNPRQRADIDLRADKLEHAPDLLRAFVLGVADRSQVENLLKSLPDAQKERLERDYAVRYGSSLSADLNKLGQPDGSDMSRLLTNRGAGDWLHNFLVDHDRTNNLLGRLATDTFSQSAQETEEQRARLQAKMAEAARHFSELKPEEQAKIVDSVAEALERYKKDKATAADVASSVAIASIAIAGSIPSGGVSLLAMAAAGGALNPLARAAILDKDYDSKQLAQDIVGGIVGGGVAGLGPTQMLKLLPLGKLVATEAAEGTAVSLGLTGAAKEALTRESIELAQNALREGGEISAKQLESLAEKIVRMPGAPQNLTRDQVLAELKREYAKAIEAGVKKELANPIVKGVVHSVTLNSAAAGAGGFVQGTASGAMQWNPEKGIYENVSSAAAQGGKSAWKSAAGAAVGTTILGGIGHFISNKGHISEQTTQRTEIELGEGVGVASTKIGGRFANAIESGAANAPGTIADFPVTRPDYSHEKRDDDKPDRVSGKHSTQEAMKGKKGDKKSDGKGKGNQSQRHLPQLEI